MSKTPEYKSAIKARAKVHALVDEYFNAIVPDVVANPEAYAGKTIRDMMDDAIDGIGQL